MLEVSKNVLKLNYQTNFVNITHLLLISIVKYQQNSNNQHINNLGQITRDDIWYAAQLLHDGSIVLKYRRTANTQKQLEKTTYIHILYIYSINIKH